MLKRAAPAKINSFLEVMRKRPDGFHDIVTIMHKLHWHDSLTFAARDDGEIRLRCDDPSLPTDERNLVVRAALLVQVGCDRQVGADIELTKRIPAGAGLGGGSSDAATTLLGLNELWGLQLSAGSLARLASMIGSDVAFFLNADAARCEGRGEVVHPLVSAPSLHLVVVWPGIAVDTKRVYGSSALDLASDRVLLGSESDYLRELRTCRPFNRLLTPCLAEFPEVGAAYRKVARMCGAHPVGLSGSGSSCFVVVEDEQEAQALADRLRAEFPPPCVIQPTQTTGSRSDTAAIL